MSTYIIVDGDKIDTKDPAIELIAIEEDDNGRHIMHFKYRNNIRECIIHKDDNS